MFLRDNLKRSHHCHVCNCWFTNSYFILHNVHLFISYRQPNFTSPVLMVHCLSSHDLLSTIYWDLMLQDVSVAYTDCRKLEVTELGGLWWYNIHIEFHENLVQKMGVQDVQDLISLGSFSQKGMQVAVCFSLCERYTLCMCKASQYCMASACLTETFSHSFRWIIAGQCIFVSGSRIVWQVLLLSPYPPKRQLIVSGDVQCKGKGVPVLN
jgi:hypothetical protein